MPLINCEINLILTWSEDYVISSAAGDTQFKMTYKTLCPSRNLSTQDMQNCLKN